MNHTRNLIPLESVGENFAVNFPESQFKPQQASINLLTKPGLLDYTWVSNLPGNAVSLPKKT
jgi:hypothetical protein